MKNRSLTRLFFVTAMVLIVGGTMRIGALYSHAQQISTQISNDGPVIVGGTVKLCDNSVAIPNDVISIGNCSNITSLNLNAGSTAEVSLFARARDNNGNSDIQSGPFNGAFYHDTNSNTGTEFCVDDQNNCYQLSCTKAVDIPTGGATDAWIRCDFEVEYFADHSDGAAEWLGYVEVFDQGLISANNGSSYSTEISKLISASFPVVNFGNRDQGTQTGVGSNLEILHQNNGNVLIDFLVSLDDDDTNQALECDTGNLSNTNIKVGIVDTTFAAAADILPAEPTTLELDIDVLQRTNDSQTVTDDTIGDIQTTYWNVNVPPSGPQGFCEEGLNVTVFEGP